LGKVPHIQPQYQDDLHGGFGGKGGNGGTGGNGGHGGSGAGGAGGSIQMISSIYEQSLIFGSFNTSGGSGGVSGAVLRNSMGSTPFYPAQTQVADFFAAGNNPYRSYKAVAANPNQPANGFTPNLPNVEGGAAPYGRLLNASNPALLDTTYSSSAMQGAPSDAIGVVTRAKPSKLLGANNDFPAYDLLTYSLRPGAPGFGPVAASPSLVAVNPADTTYRPTSPIRLKTAGYLNDPTFTPGATGPVNITGMISGQTFATLIDRGKLYETTAGFTPYGKERLFFGAPTYDAGGAAVEPIYLYDRGLLKVGVDVNAGSAPTQSYLSGGIEENTLINPVATPLILRRGAPLAVTTKASNIGNFLTTTSGVVQGNAPGVSLEPTSFSIQNGFVTSSSDHTFNIDTRQTAAGTQVQRVLSAQVIPHYDDQLDPVADIEVYAQLYSPKWQTVATVPGGTMISSVGGDPNNQPTLPFSGIAVGQNSGALLQVMNNGDSDANTAIDSTLSRMTVLDVSITGPDAAAFSLPNLSSLGPTYDPGSFQFMSIGFSPSHAGTNTATLRITTDINAAYGTPGDVFVIPLSGLVVPGNISGDYNNSGTVDGADYVAWRNVVGTSTTLPNDPLGGTIGTPQYNQLRANFGKTNNSQGSAALASVPEPSCAVLLILGSAVALLRRRQESGNS
jgi:hypothetical protein